MAEQPPVCGSCDQRMEQGFTLDHGYGAVFTSAWVAGTPRWSRWLGLRLKGRDKLPVTTFRCPGCGRLESYAQPGPWPA